MIDFEKALIEQASADIRAKLSRLRCPSHGRRPQASIRGESLSNFSCEVSACCQPFKDYAVNELGFRRP